MVNPRYISHSPLAMSMDVDNYASCAGTSDNPSGSSSTVPSSSSSISSSMVQIQPQQPPQQPQRHITDEEFNSIIALLTRVINHPKANYDDVLSAYRQLWTPEHPWFTETKRYRWLHGQEYDVAYDVFLRKGDMDGLWDLKCV
ncbi:hypothetical protein CVT24_010964 [Panaeolus cyanescens]|uniref:Uncharacterized protein n=1 Tax=Panaeolus cyanescens TaxID=181874 RepID=A0A409WDJ0_9AGAR|nr:hypothetical protein CVT24_010964 [Panaeolus cyanescens]